MGQSINVLLYGVRIPDGLDYESVEALCGEWRLHVADKVAAFEERLRTNGAWWIADHAYVPRTPCPDDAVPDNLIGFYVCRGSYDSASSHRFTSMTFAELRHKEPTATIIRRCRRRWSRFARWARKRGVEFGKPRIWYTRTEVA